jgi:hypothetical protein
VSKVQGTTRSRMKASLSFLNQISGKMKRPREQRVHEGGRSETNIGIG